MNANAITAGLLLAISEKYQPRCLIFRINVIVARASRGTVRSAPNGCPDILGIVEGRAVVIEVKAGRDTLRPAQIHFRDQWIKAGGAYILARDIENAMADLESQVRGGAIERTN
jgi:hypothetical protein